MTEADIERESGASAPGEIEDTRISDAIGKILSNPELMGMIGSMMGSMRSEQKPEAEAFAAKTAPQGVSGAQSGDILSAIAPVLSSLGGSLPLKSSAEAEHRACLLRALKPYLSKERCEAIEQMITIGRISEIFKGMS